jgi:hypothetical protein
MPGEVKYPDELTELGKWIRVALRSPFLCITNIDFYLESYAPGEPIRIMLTEEKCKAAACIRVKV